MRSADRRRARLATVVSFSSFFVFPAIPIGRTVAITIPLVLAAALALVWVRRLRTSDWGPYAWMIAPAVVSGCYVVLVGAALAPDIVPKAVIATAMSLFVVIPARRLLRSGSGEQFVLGAAYAILVHAALGAYQVFQFDRGEFPFADLMRTNPAMALLAEDTPTYVEYVKRPFGLFAEPSAMAACVGPWLVMSTSHGPMHAAIADGSAKRPNGRFTYSTYVGVSSVSSAIAGLGLIRSANGNSPRSNANDWYAPTAAWTRMAYAAPRMNRSPYPRRIRWRAGTRTKSDIAIATTALGTMSGASAAPSRTM